MSLSPAQRHIAQTIVQVGRRRGASRKEIIAALETARVESNFSNPRGGDRDSSGWRQERASSYPGKNRTNVRAAARRFYSETAAAGRGKGKTAGQLAQSVQRSAYPGKYDAVKGEAVRLYKGLGGGGGANVGGGSNSTTSVSVTNPAIQGSDMNLSGLISGLQKPAPVQASAPPAPSFASRPALPSGYQAPQGAISVPAPSLSEQLSAVQQLGPTIEHPTVSVSTTSGGGGGGSGGSPRGGSGGAKVKGPLKELFWQGAGGINVKNGQRVPQGFVSGHTDHVHVAGSKGSVVHLGKLAQQMGLHVGENPHFGSVNPVHTNGSYHYSGRAIDVSGSPAKMRKFAHRVARIYGI